MQILFALLGVYLSPVLIYSFAVALDNQPGLSLRETFDVYVKSVQNSDLAALFGTVTEGDDFFFLTADGRLLNRAGYYEFHEAWFRERDWEMPVDCLKVKEGKDYGFTNAIFYYKAKMPDGRIYSLDSYFTLIFRKEHRVWKVVADLCTPIKRYIRDPESDLQYDMDQEYLFKTIDGRRTVRAYRTDPVPDAHIMRILDTARFAPTAGNIQPWKFVVLKDRKHLDDLAETLKAAWEGRISSEKGMDDVKREEYIDSGKKAIAGVMAAPVFVLVFVDTSVYPQSTAWDGCLAVENLMLAAKSLGYGTGFFTTYFPEDVIKHFVKAPDDLQSICATPIGIPQEWPEIPEKKDLDEFLVYESFQ
jgi:nitroreductase/ketosteroid isomerase-like protein